MGEGSGMALIIDVDHRDYTEEGERESCILLRLVAPEGLFRSRWRSPRHAFEVPNTWIAPGQVWKARGSLAQEKWWQKSIFTDSIYRKLQADTAGLPKVRSREPYQYHVAAFEHNIQLHRSVAKIHIHILQVHPGEETTSRLQVYTGYSGA